MNSAVAAPLADPEALEPALDLATRPFFWSVRRELWENRSIYLAPLGVAVLVLFGTLANVAGRTDTFRAATALAPLAPMPPAEQQALMLKPFKIAPAPIMLATFLIGLFYSLDALYGERRDRSLLFWKSLPVSDATAVLAKATVPLVVLPLVAFALSVVTWGVLLFLGSAILAANGVSSAPIWAGVRLFQEPAIMLYGLTVHALWFAPIYGWLLLVSAWARRLPLLWAALPLFALAVVEGIATGGARFGSLLQYRVAGAMSEAFAADYGAQGLEWPLTPVRFLTAPGLWLGLAFAAACLAGATRLRRRREPI